MQDIVLISYSRTTSKILMLIVSLSGSLLQNAYIIFFKTVLIILSRDVIIRLKKINPMSQSCRAHLFFGARLIQQKFKV